MSAAAPFFSQRLLVTAPDGTYGGIRRRCAVRAFENRMELGDLTIAYQYLAQLRVYGNVLHVGYVASDARQVELFFRYDTFFPKTGAKALAEMVEKVNAAREAIVKPSVWRPASETSPPVAALQSELLEPASNGWSRVAVYSALVAFPAVCPVCVRPAESVGMLQTAAGFNQKGVWLVPTCRDHEREFVQHLAAANWRADRSRLEFNVWNPRYAKLFAALNSGEESDELRKISQSSPLLYDIKSGVQFVQYQCAVSIIVVSFLMPSKIETIQTGQSPFTRGIKYSLISLLAGWWGIPAGPIFTIASVVRNCRGGIDLTGTVAAVLTGSAISAGGYQ
ncbi:MAG TPA: hypothetical protein VEK11_14205 [Thermoanaerobaculia bacterium]|nr:hypothetical protein [Thermoanaerobaculia bacterium]